MVNLTQKMEEFKSITDIELLDLFSEMYYYDSSNYISDIIKEVSDANVDIYTSHLLNWSCEHCSDIEDSIIEYGINESMSFIDIIRQGQFYYYDSILNNSIYEFIRYYIIRYLIDTEQIVKECLFDELMDDFHYHYIERIEDIKNFIEKYTIFYSKEEEVA